MDSEVRYIDRHWADIRLLAIRLARPGNPVKLQVLARDPERLILLGNFHLPSKYPKQINIQLLNISAFHNAILACG